jgi:hypothetical protein
MPELIESGVRLPCPDGCSDGMYGLLLQCWEYDSVSRPTFKRMVHLHVISHQIPSAIRLELTVSLGALVSTQEAELGAEDGLALQYLIQQHQVLTSQLDLELAGFRLLHGPATKRPSASSVGSLRAHCFFLYDPYLF